MNFIKKFPTFIAEVRQESRRITWPSRKEVLLTSLFVFIFTVVASIFFFITDSFLFKMISLVIGA
jgi:preprotein translocase subunit SecE